MDLDNTLYRNNNIHPDDINFLKNKEKKYLRVIATGRNLYSVAKVLPNNFPIDYLIASSGTVIMDWKNKKLIQTYSLNSTDITIILSVIKKNQLDFMIHDAVPDNHKFQYKKLNTLTNTDFYQRIKLYKDFVNKFEMDLPANKIYSMLLSIIDKSSEELFIKLQKELTAYNVVRSTSPLDHKSMWIEIYPKSASKEKAAVFIIELEKIDLKKTYGIGNDFNDLGFLDLTNYSYIIDEGKDIDYNKYKTLKNDPSIGILDQIFSC